MFNRYTNLFCLIPKKVFFSSFPNSLDITLQLNSFPAGGKLTVLSVVSPLSNLAWKLLCLCSWKSCAALRADVFCYNVGLIFVLLVITQICFDNILVTKIIADLWSLCDSMRATYISGQTMTNEAINKPTVRPYYLNQLFGGKTRNVCYNFPLPCSTTEVRVEPGINKRNLGYNFSHLCFLL